MIKETYSDDINYFLNKELFNYTAFDEIEFCYQQLCRILLDNKREQKQHDIECDCPNNFVLSLFYLMMPLQNKNKLILELKKIMEKLHYNETYIEALQNPFINEFFQDRNIENHIYHFNEKQIERLYQYYYELLSDI